MFHCKYEKTLSDKTLKAYKIDLNQFQDFIIKQFNNKEISAIDKDMLKEYIRHLSGFMPKTIKRKIATIKALFSFLEFDDYIIANPFRKIRISIKEHKHLPMVMSFSEMECIFKSVYTALSLFHDKNRYTYNQTVRDVAIIEMLFATGVRVSELCGLKKDNVAADFSYILVNGKGSKQRIISIGNSKTRKALESYYQLFYENINITGFFFINRLGKQLSEQSVRYTVRRYATKRINGNRVTPHVFRHTFATLLLEQEVDIRYIQSLLGHSSINVTQIYTHVTDKKKNEILNLRHPRNLMKV